MPCRVGTAKADLTDRQRDRWGDAEIKSSTRISEASDTLACALWFSERGSCLTVTHCVDTHSCQRGSNKSAQRPAPPAPKKEKIYHLGDAVRRHAVKLLICDVSYQLNVFLVRWCGLCVVQGQFVSLYPALPGGTLCSIELNSKCSLKWLNEQFSNFYCMRCYLAIRKMETTVYRPHNRHRVTWHVPESHKGRNCYLIIARRYFF